MSKLTIKPDVIVTWPRNTEYPLWRVFIRDNRDTFNKVFIVFMETHSGDDYRSFIRSVMPPDSYTILDSPFPVGGEDWRNVAVNEALKRSESEWVWFTEQDFFPKNEQFWDEVNDAIINYNMEAIGVMQGARIHPCCLFMTRQLLNKTNFNFGIDPGRLDHFGMLIQDLERMNVNMAMIDPALWKHYNGLSHNWRLVSEMKEVTYQPVEFYDYLARCLQAPTDLDVRFKAIAEQALKRSINAVSNTAEKEKI